MKKFFLPLSFLFVLNACVEPVFATTNENIDAQTLVRIENYYDNAGNGAVEFYQDGNKIIRNEYHEGTWITDNIMYEYDAENRLIKSTTYDIYTHDIEKEYTFIYNANANILYDTKANPNLATFNQNYTALMALFGMRKGGIFDLYPLMNRLYFSGVNNPLTFEYFKNTSTASVSYSYDYENGYPVERKYKLNNVHYYE